MESTKMINKKVPGAVPPIGKLEDEANKFKKEIIKKKTCELKDLLNRQNAILQNPKLIATLADKGEKVRLRQQMLQGIIESRESCSVDNASNLLEKMGINDASKPIDINKMEWQLGGANLMNQYNNLKKLDSDDESDYEGDTENIENDVEFQKNPLKLLASRSEVSSYKIKKTYATSLAERGDTGTKNSKSDIDVIEVSALPWPSNLSNIKYSNFNVLDQIIKSVNYGFYSWNPLVSRWKRMRDLEREPANCSKPNSPILATCEKRITIENIQDRLLFNQKPPSLRDIDKTKALIFERKILPNELNDYPVQNVNHNLPPHIDSKAIPLFVAQHRGCNLEEIDFFIGGSILGILNEKFIQKGDTILLHIKKGIIIIEKTTSRNLNMNDAGHKFERIVSDGAFNHENNMIFNRNLRKVFIGNHRVLINSEIDCVDQYENPIEVKFWKESVGSYNRERERKLLFQMISNGSSEVVIGSKFIDTKRKCHRIVDIKKYGIDHFANNVLKETSIAIIDLLHPIIDSLNKVKALVDNGTIKALPNYYYKLDFVPELSNEGFYQLKMKIEHIELKGTGEYCSQYLYDQLISTTSETIRSLQQIREYPSFYNSLVNANCRNCHCEKNSAQLSDKVNKTKLKN